MADANNMTDKTKTTINDATDLAEETGNIQLEPIHIAVTVFDENALGSRMCKKAPLFAPWRPSEMK